MGGFFLLQKPTKRLQMSYKLSDEKDLTKSQNTFLVLLLRCIIYYKKTLHKYFFIIENLNKIIPTCFNEQPSAAPKWPQDEDSSQCPVTPTSQCPTCHTRLPRHQHHQ